MIDGIERAKAGVPQIVVTFDIDANGILKVHTHTHTHTPSVTHTHTHKRSPLHTLAILCKRERESVVCERERAGEGGRDLRY